MSVIMILLIPTFNIYTEYVKMILQFVSTTNVIFSRLNSHCININQSINQVYFQINMYKNEQKVHISQIDRKKVEVEVSNL